MKWNAIAESSNRFFKFRRRIRFSGNKFNSIDYLQACGCVIYYMPRMNADAKICSQANVKCYNSIRILIERGDDIETKCNCLPGCIELSFTGEISSAPLTTLHFQKENHLANFSAETIRHLAKCSLRYYSDFNSRENMSSISGEILRLFKCFSRRVCSEV